MKEKNTILKYTISIARILFGITFMFSGFVKAIDPLGFTYKIEDYLISFNFLQFAPLALAFALFLILLEFVLGVSILLGLYRRITSVLALLFMIVMTPLTLYIALYNPVHDCGCFGDALIISNWDTFYKNIVLLFFAIILLVYHIRIKPFYTNKFRKGALIFAFLFCLVFSFYNIWYLPVVDFRPYKIGVNIPSTMEEDFNEGDVYENIYVYEKDGNQKEFTEDNYPWQDSTWTYVDIKTNLIEEGNKPIVEDFSIIAYQKFNDEFVKTDDITDEVLSKSLCLLVVTNSLDNAKEKNMKQISELAEYAKKEGVSIYVVTASNESVITKWDDINGNPYLNYASMDDRTLKTIIRSNPGLVLLKEGTILNKWSRNNIPNSSQLNDVIIQSQSDNATKPFNNLFFKLLIICTIFVFPLIGIKFYDTKYRRRLRFKKHDI